MTDTPTDLDRAIAERLGWQVGRMPETVRVRLELAPGEYYSLFTPQNVAILPSPKRTLDVDECWAYLNGKWTEDIGAALALVEELGIRLSLDYWPSSAKKWVAANPAVSWLSCDTPAKAVARAVWAWLQAQEVERG